MSICERLKLLRVKHGLSQAVFAEIAGLTQSYYAKVEKDEYELKTSSVVSICKHFDISADFLLFGSEKLNIKRLVNALDKSETMIKLLDKKIDPEMRARLIISYYSEGDDNV